ncbi:hypothetical protein OF83DRAFT_1178130 [Amylostereum chailletii]|nr:hypothetical protein OF83DRAFT_1178130 [Amylostereum chailletii]
MVVIAPRTSLSAFSLLAASIFNLLFIGWHLMSSSPQTYSWRGHDHPETLPLPMDDLPQVSLIVEESVHYPILGLPSDDQWFGLASASYGYVRLGPDDRQFVVTMFHELHCMRLLNRAFSKEEVATVDHVKHCLAYIRQGALCAADLTLEEGNFEERDFERVRTGGHHVCRDWTAVYPVIDDNFFEWKNRTHYEAFLPPGYLPVM